MYEKYRKRELANHPQLKSEFTRDPRVIAMVRQTLSNIINPRSNTEQPRIIIRDHAISKNTYFLIALYKANPELLTPLYPEFESDAEIVKAANEARDKFISVLSKKHSLTFELWRETAKEAIKHDKADTLHVSKRQ